MESTINEPAKVNNNQALIDGLRAAADFLAERPEFPLLNFNLETWINQKGLLKAAVRQMGNAEKIYGQSWMCFRKQFGPIKIDLNTCRDTVCTKVQTGTKVVPAIPAIPEHEEPVYEWECGSVLADLGGKFNRK